MVFSGDDFQRGAIYGFSLSFAEIEKSDLDFSIFSRGLDKRRGEEGRWASHCSRLNAGIIEHSLDGSDWVDQDLFVEKNSFKWHLNRIYILQDGLDPNAEHTLSVRISEKRNALSKGNNCRIVYFGLNGDPRTPKGADVDGVYFDGSSGYGPEK